MRLSTVAGPRGSTLLLGQHDTGQWVNLTAVLPGVRDVGSLLALGGHGLADARQALRAVPVDAVEPGRVTLLAPVLSPSAIYGVGGNFRCLDGTLPPGDLTIFMKAPSALVGPGHAMVGAEIFARMDCETELTAVVGRRVRGVSATTAADCIAGYTIMSDITARDPGLIVGGIVRAKSLDTVAPLGPIFVTPEELPALADVQLETRVNGQVVQAGRAGDMIRTPAELLSELSRHVTLRPGDLISTGSPAMLLPGGERRPWLDVGDRIECAVTGIGVLASTVVCSSPPDRIAMPLARSAS